MHMRKTFIAVYFFLFGWLLCFPYIGQAREIGVTRLQQAVRCLVTKGFLTTSGTGELKLGYLLDASSFPGKEMLYVVTFGHHRRKDGSIFTIFVNEDSGRQRFDIQNNAPFTFSRNGSVTFNSPPLGGTWTQEHLVSAIKKIEKRPKIRYLHRIKTDSSLICTAYTDSNKD